ncbi:hypothetical protein V8J82_13720 [Gymnodinialimonas sp. 2305UL16-5]|uniref:hypothetical protein n=1 Tax=Gymnodinialimonas mytili TaxID=3126503 RepID=UPI0030950240
MVRFWQPVFRSRPQGQVQLTIRNLVKIGLITWLGPALLGGVLLAISSLFADLTDFETGQAFSLFAGLLAAAVFYGILAVSLAICLFSLLMGIGWAGWITPLLLSIAISVAIGTILNMLTPGIGTLVFMVVTRLWQSMSVSYGRRHAGSAQRF